MADDRRQAHGPHRLSRLSRRAICLGLLLGLHTRHFRRSFPATLARFPLTPHPSARRAGRRWRALHPLNIPGSLPAFAADFPTARLRYMGQDDDNLP